MTGAPEALAQRYMKEQQEYHDALAAYQQTIARAASSGPIPTALQSGASAISEDPQRIANDPYMLQNHPDIAAAAARVAKEEQEFRAVDDPSAYHGNNKCDIGGYIGEKFYEYAALAEMVYKLATDSAFREQVFSQLETQVKESAENGLLHDAWTLFTLRGRVLDQLSAPTAEERLQGIQREVGEAKAAIDRITSRIQAYFAGKWDEFKQAWAECGLGNAVVKAGIDGVFLVGELMIAGVVIKQGLRLVYTLTKNGLHRVEIMAVGTAKTLGHYEWKGEDLTAKYKAANENHVGGRLPDHNRDLPDEPAEGMGVKSAAADSDEVKRPPRSQEELAPGGQVPLHTNGKGRFVEWWNDLSEEELDMLWKDKKIKQLIKNQVRAPGGLHEWLMTGQGPKLKRLGFTMNEIKAMTTPTKQASGPIKDSNKRWRHTTEDGKTGEGANDMHKALEEVISGAEDRQDLIDRMRDFSYDWIDNGPEGFPPDLRDLINGTNN